MMAADTADPVTVAGPAAASAADESARWQLLAEPNSAAVEQPVSLRRILLQAGASILVVLAVVAIGGVFISQRIAKREAVHDVAQLTDLLAESVVQPALTDAMVTDPAAATAGLDTIVRRGILNTEVVRVKLWTPGGLVLYSDEAALIGKTFPLDDEATEALTTPATEAGITDLDRPENSLDPTTGKLLEVYRPVWTPTGQPLLFEAYFQYGVVTNRSTDLWRGFSGVMLSSLASVFVLLTPVLWAFYKRARSAQRQREALLNRAMDASMEERQRIAATLHDGVVQHLAGAAFVIAGESQGAAGRGDPALAGRLDEAGTAVRDSIAGMRSLLVDIYPQSLANGGLATALADLRRTLSGTAVTIRLSIDPDAVAELDDAQHRAVFRVAQECLRNAVRHANATHASVELTRGPDGVRLDVADDGNGFDVAAVQSSPAEGHFGLRLMTDVAVEAGARFSVASSPAGTCFRMEFTP